MGMPKKSVTVPVSVAVRSWAKQAIVPNSAIKGIRPITTPCYSKGFYFAPAFTYARITLPT